MIDLPTEATVTCDECGEEVTVELSEYVGEPPTVGVDPSSLEEIGWVDDGGSQFCPECAKSH